MDSIDGDIVYCERILSTTYTVRKTVASKMHHDGKLEGLKLTIVVDKLVCKMFQLNLPQNFQECFKNGCWVPCCSDL